VEAVALQVAFDLRCHVGLADGFGGKRVDVGEGAVDQAVPEEAAEFLDVHLLLGDGTPEPQAAEFPALVLKVVPVEDQTDAAPRLPELEDGVLERALAVGEEQQVGLFQAAGRQQSGDQPQHGRDTGGSERVRRPVPLHVRHGGPCLLLAAVGAGAGLSAGLLLLDPDVVDGDGRCAAAPFVREGIGEEFLGQDVGAGVLRQAFADGVVYCLQGLDAGLGDFGIKLEQGPPVRIEARQREQFVGPPVKMPHHGSGFVFCGVAERAQHGAARLLSRAVELLKALVVREICAAGEQPVAAEPARAVDALCLEPGEEVDRRVEASFRPPDPMAGELISAYPTVHPVRYIVGLDQVAWSGPLESPLSDTLAKCSPSARRITS
jgi:hypothetical protein